jgi:glutathione S-transferase
MAVAAETGHADRIEIIPTVTRDPNSGLSKDNPLAKIPVLITDSGEKLYDSAVICEYLDSLHEGPKLLPPAGEERWRALRFQALGDGILEASVLCMMESRRSEGERSAAWVKMQKGKIASAVDALEDEAENLGDSVTIGAIAVGCALGYLDFGSAPREAT